jgi:hypothetical protein
MAHQVLAGGYTRWDLDVDLSLVCNHAINTPCLIGRNQSILLDFEPFQPGDVQ